MTYLKKYEDVTSIREGHSVLIGKSYIENHARMLVDEDEEFRFALHHGRR